MTWVNVTIPRASEMDERCRLHLLKRELEFWREQAEQLRGALENVYEHAAANGHVELRLGGEKLDLFTRKSSGSKGSAS
jgi:uncharacterized protein YigA (DUF484 family)